MTSTLIVFRPDYDRIPPELWDEAGRFTPAINGSYTQNQRLPEYTQQPGSINPEHPDDPTHVRPGPWIVLDDGDQYSTDFPGMADFDEVVVYRLGYDPLPESENPWASVEVEHKGTNGLTPEQLADAGLEVISV